MSREELRMLIHVALTVRRTPERRKLDLLGSHAVKTVTDDLVARIMGREDSETILIRPDMIGPAHAPSHGRWDVDEPHPHPDMPFRHHIPMRRSEDSG